MERGRERGRKKERQKSFVPSVEATGNVCVVDERDELFVRAALEIAVAFAEINIDLDGVFDSCHRVEWEVEVVTGRRQSRLNRRLKEWMNGWMDRWVDGIDR